MLNSDYPYTSGTTNLPNETSTGVTCLFDITKVLQNVSSQSGWILPSAALTALQNNGPINIYIYVCNTFRYYTSGYLSASSVPSTCQPSGGNVNHSVSLVGHETTAATTKTTTSCRNATSAEKASLTCTTGTFKPAVGGTKAKCCTTTTTAVPGVKVWKI